MKSLESLPQILRGNKRKAKSPARHREAYRSRLVPLGCEMLEDRVMLSAALPDYNFLAPALVAGTTQHNTTSSPGTFAETPGGATNRSVSIGSMNAVLPAAPSFTATPVSGTQINLAWTRVAGATSYQIAEVVNGAWKNIGSLGSGSTSYAVTGLSPNTTYTFDVGTSNAAGTNWAPCQNATTLTLTLPAAPSFTATPVSGTQINLAWTRVAGATSYQIAEVVNGAWKNIGSLGSGSISYAVIGLSPNTTYTFDVGTSNAAGTNWAPCQNATTLTLALPAAPSFTATPVSGTQINLAWTRVAGATSYQIAEVVNGAWKNIGSLGSGSISYAVTGLSPNTTYSFEVGASNAAGTNWANYKSATTFQNNVVVDHPVAATSYSPVSGSLFGANGPSYLDVQQGQVGDCWLLSSLAETAARYPSDIRNMFTDLGTAMESGSVVELYKVRFFNTAGVPTYVTVDTELPSGGGYYAHTTNGVLWVAMAEKAYAQANGVALRHHLERGQRLLQRPERRRSVLGVASHHWEAGQRLQHQPHQHHGRMERGSAHCPRLEHGTGQPLHRGKRPRDPRLRRGQLQRFEQPALPGVQPVGD